MSLRICSFVSRLPVRPQGETRSLQTALWKEHGDARRAQARQAMMGQSAHTFPSHLPATPRVVPAWQDALEWCPSTVPFQPESPLWPQPTALPCWSWGLSPSHRPSQGTERAAGIPALRNPEHPAGTADRSQRLRCSSALALGQSHKPCASRSSFTAPAAVCFYVPGRSRNGDSRSQTYSCFPLAALPFLRKSHRPGQGGCAVPGGQGAAPAPPVGTPGTPGTSALCWVCAHGGAKDGDAVFSLCHWSRVGLWCPAVPSPARCWERTPQSPCE